MSDFKKSTIYQIYIKSFKDSNGDGTGDINGIRSKLPYLKSLGIDCVWITPCFRSPMNDNGYDVADYYSINPMFGTMEDACSLISEAREKGIGVMFDMVFNHTSTEHEWFQKALSGDPEYMDYYIFRDGPSGEPEGTPPTNWMSKFGGSAWEYVPHLGKWYLHLFDVTQADLNWDNPKVRDELKKVILFWKDKGLSGFRFDVVNLISKPAVFENDHAGDGRRFYSDGPHVHEYLKELVRDTGIEDMITVGEMSSTSLDNCVRYTNPAEHELSMIFSFHHLKVDYKDGFKWALKAPDLKELRNLFKDWQEQMQEKGGWNATFLCNHDQPRTVSRFGDDRDCWKESAKMLATLTHMMRGTPYVYQGEEIGMTNVDYTTIEEYRDVESLNYYKILLDEGKNSDEALHIIHERSRDNGRTPVQWTGGDNAGFTTGTPWIGVPSNHTYINVETEEKDETSILAYYKKLIEMRKDYPVISEGTIRFLDAGTDEVIAYMREFEGERLIVICNMTGSSPDASRIKIPSDARRLLGNYPEETCPGRLRPYEAAVYHTVEKAAPNAAR